MKFSNLLVWQENLLRLLSIRCFLIAASLCWLSACATTGTTPVSVSAASGSTVLSDQQVQDIEARLQRLQDSVVMLEARLLDQQRVIESLKQRPGQDSGTAVSGIDNGSNSDNAPGSAQQSPTEIYLAAFGDYAAGQYQKSINGFSRFLQFFPANDYASNARYWLAECYLALGQYEQAIADFDKVVADYPKSAKAPDALLKKAAALYQANEEESAIETIQLLKERYPKSSAARKAAESFN